MKRFQFLTTSKCILFMYAHCFRYRAACGVPVAQRGCGVLNLFSNSFSIFKSIPYVYLIVFSHVTQSIRSFYRFRLSISFSISFNVVPFFTVWKQKNTQKSRLCPKLRFLSNNEQEIFGEIRVAASVSASFLDQKLRKKTPNCRYKKKRLIQKSIIFFSSSIT